ncbi:MAG: nitrile hydratase accessory protein [Paracoccus sp. (in: a-proteobacteria)]|uniref:nitrile hydratase accessory protein n=1 Tax=Paracoccus sp. TaxID=267 RepID=UPI00391D92E5
MTLARDIFDTLPQPHFAEPWQAKAFAMTVRLHEQGAFAWPEWTETFSAQIHSRPGETDLADVYFTQWLTALETLLARKGLTDATQLHRARHAWEHAAARTPHGHPVELTAQDFPE